MQRSGSGRQDEGVPQRTFSGAWLTFCCSPAQPCSGKVRRFVFRAGLFFVLVLLRTSEWRRASWTSTPSQQTSQSVCAVAFHGAFTAAQVFNIDQSLLLSSSFITTPAILLSPPHPSLFCSPVVLSHCVSCSPQYQTSLQLCSFPSPTRFLSSSHQSANVPSAAKLAPWTRTESREAVLLICSCSGS